MSWEAWGTPPDPEPGPEPDPDWMAPPLEPGQEWCCGNGCGPCSVKTIPFVYWESRDQQGNLLGQETTPIDVSSCCGAELMLWDTTTKQFLDWQPIVRPPSPS